MPKVTIIDIARRAGVGVGTASRALNNSPDVRPATRDRVLAAANELNYHPSAVAQRLQGRRSGVIAFVHEVGDAPTGDMHFKDFISVLARSCARQDLDLLIHPVGNGEAFHQAFLRLLRGGRADGLILADIREDDPRVAFLSAEKLPFVAFGRTRSSVDYPYVDLDSQAGSFAAASHLIEQGRRRIGFIGLPLHFSFAQHRLAGYRQALDAYGLPFQAAYVSTNLHTETETRAAVTAMLKLPRRPDAIAAASDLLAIYAMHAIEEAGLIPGRDVAVVGFDDLPLAAHTRPSLTTVRQPFDLICDLLISTLIGVIEQDPNIAAQSLVQPTLVVRDSSAPHTS